MSVSLAYSLAPIVGGEVTQYIGFRWLMSIVGCIQFIYAIILLSFLLNNKTFKQVIVFLDYFLIYNFKFNYVEMIILFLYFRVLMLMVTRIRQYC